MKFERALIGKKPKQELVLTNSCAIPVNWKMTGVSELPEEFFVTKASAKATPAKKETRRSKEFDDKGKAGIEPKVQRVNSMTSE